jgi:hypothetical protein
MKTVMKKAGPVMLLENTLPSSREVVDVSECHRMSLECKILKREEMGNKYIYMV